MNIAQQSVKKSDALTINQALLNISSLPMLWFNAPNKNNKLILNSADYLLSRLGINIHQALILAAIINNHHGSTSLSEIADRLNCSILSLKAHQSDIDHLIDLHLVNRGFNRSKERVYLIPEAVHLAFEKNEAYVCPDRELKSDTDLLDALDELYYQRGTGDMGTDQLYDEIDALLDRAAHLPFVKKFRSLTHFVTKAEQRVLLFAICEKQKFCYDHITPDNFRFVLMPSDFRELVFRRAADCQLVRKGLVHYSIGKDRAFCQAKYHLTDKVDKTFNLSGGNTRQSNNPLEIDNQPDESSLGRLVKHQDIVPKDLFYNPADQKNIDGIANLLKPDQYNRVQAELANSHMRGSVNILLYGAPGTGKTEGVLQLARRSGRDLFMVDFSQIRDMYVGNSEKNTKRVFDEYRKLVQESQVAPILFINEADGLLCRRQTNVTQTSQRVDNTMQNIILQEMETLPGIMICTTNLATNLDDAFERRFIVKIGIERPNTEVRARIWQSMMPHLSHDQALALANDFDLAGGNMENVARKQTMEKVLYNQEVSMDRLRELCQLELISTESDKGNRKKIGF